ncbi:MAG: hypothetical protein LBI77_00190 [Puniceicoccales bacterium]|jgi:hypothetical protein|nr:hypothetical protein [Puniceicoccales bacterium]
MKLGRTLVLSATILVLIFINYYLLKEQSPPQRSAQEESKYTERNVFRIEILSKASHIVLGKDKNNNWKMIEPFSWPVNGFAVEEFFQILRQNPTTSQFSIIKLSKIGQRIIIPNPPSTSTDSLSKKHLDKIIDSGLLFWCQQKICPLNLDEIVRLELKFHETEQQFSLSKKNSIWKFEQPIKIEADTPSIQKIMEWITNLEVLPLTEDEFLFNFFPHRDKDIPNSFVREPYLTITWIDNHRKKFSIICGHFRENNSTKALHYAWLEGHPALFPIPWDEDLDHPLQSLCMQSLFLEIKSITFSFGQQKLFLSCNESGEWSVLKFFGETLQSLENFDVKSLLLFLSLVKPLDVIPRSMISDTTPREKFFLEINGTLKFEALMEENTAYLLPMDKNYAIIINGDLLQKLFKILRGNDNRDIGLP